MLNISIIIINYNTFQLTEECIRSIITKTKDITYEIILVDNASTEENADKFKILFPQVNLVKNNQNIGFARGNNSGIKISKGDYILLLNSDTILKNNAIYYAWQKMKSNPELGALSSMLISSDGAMQYAAERFPSLKTEIKELLRFNKCLSETQKVNMYLGASFDHQSEKEADWIWGTFFMIPRRIIEELGGKLPDKIFMYAEDMDWCWKIKRLGYKIWYYPKAEVIHYGGKSMPNQKEDIKFHKYMFPNKFFVVKENKSYLYAWLLYFVKCLHHLTLRTETDNWKAKQYLKFLFGEKHYWLNS